MQIKRTYKSFCIGDLIAPIIKKFIGKHGLFCMEILQNWSSIVPQDIASCSIAKSFIFKPGKNSGGILYIQCSPGIGIYLMYHKERILSHVNHVFGYSAIDSIRITTDLDLENGNG